MGLDWNPLSRPRPGFEAEFAELFRGMEATRESPDEKRLARFHEISEAPFVALGAPRVGFDAAADAWLRERLKPGADFEQARAAMEGYYVLDLLPECDGFPAYSNYGLYEGVDRYSFRAQFLKDVEDVLGPELMERAYQTMLADQLRALGETLLEKARAVAAAHGVQDVERVRKPEFDEKSSQSRAHILFAAAKWCLYWAERGFGLEPWF